MADFSLEFNKAKAMLENSEPATTETGEDSQEDAVRSQAEENVRAIFESDFDDPNARQNIFKPMEEFGLQAINRSSSRNKLLSSRISRMSAGGEDAADIGSNLALLHTKIKDLDPGALNFAKKGLFGKFFNPIRKYFRKYQNADIAIAGIVKSLESGGRKLANDNVALEAEEAELRKLTEKLNTNIDMGRVMDAAIESQLEMADNLGKDPAKIKFIREEIQFPLKQRIMDMQQMVVVNQQGIISMNLIRKNNKNLLNGVERTKNVTLTALRTGVIVANTLYNQKVIIDKINILNETTENIIDSISRMLRDQGSEIHQQSMESMISIDTLKRAFSIALAAIEEMSTYRENAIPQMQQAIDDFRAMADEGQLVVDRLVPVYNE